MFSEKEAIELTNALTLKFTPIVKGRSNILENFCQMNAKYYKKIVCESKMSEKFILNACAGTFIIGSYL